MNLALLAPGWEIPGYLGDESWGGHGLEREGTSARIECTSKAVIFSRGMDLGNLTAI